MCMEGGMSPEALLETLRLHGKSSVCCIEPRDAREWAEVVAALLAAQRYTAIVPHPDAVESVDRTLELAARVVELEQEVARLSVDLDTAKGGLAFWMRETQTAERHMANLRRERMQSVTQQVAEANLGQRCGFCGEPKPAAELVNGECADKAACARGVQAAAGGAR